MNGKTLSSLRMAHLGKILSNLTFVGAAVCVASVVSYLFLALYYIFLLMIILLSLFTIFILYPDISNWFDADFSSVLGVFSTAIPVVAPITAVVAGVSIALLVLSRQKGNVARIVFTAIALIIGLLFSLISFTS